MNLGLEKLFQAEVMRRAVFYPAIPREEIGDPFIILEKLHVDVTQ